jgi:NADPH-dependent curcumin reductase CurA
MTDSNRQLRLKERPTGRVGQQNFDLVEEPVPEIGEGEALVRTHWISLDPTNRVWMSQDTYLPMVAIGEVMRAAGVGQVVASRHERYPEGAWVTGLTGWQDYVVTSDSYPLQAVPENLPASPSAMLGILGLTGLTAWVGLKDIGKPQPAETVVVSAAAGAVGTAAGQIAKIHGARTVGIAGGPEKCAWLVDEIGYDVAVDYKAPDWREQLAAATPDGVDVNFENVGGDIMDAVVARLNLRARMPLCGLISGYNDAEPPPGPRSFGVLLTNRVRLEGFIILDHYARFAEGTAQLAKWMAEGKLKNHETVVEGLETLPDTLNMLFDGGNLGKLVVKVADPA